MADALALIRAIRAAEARTGGDGKKERREVSPTPVVDPAPPSFLISLFPSPPIPWDQERASRMMFDADTLVEHLGVSGLHPEIQSAADKVVGANRARDVAKFADAITEFEAAVRRVALPGGKSSKLA